MSMNPTLSRILIDIDGVCANYTQAVVDIVNEITGRKHTVDDCTIYKINKSLNLSEDEAEVVNRRIREPGFCRDIQPYPGAVEAVARLRELAPVYIVTAPLGDAPHWVGERDQWIEHHFGLPDKKIVRTDAKYVVSGAVLVDDKPEHIIEWQRHNPHGLGILFDQPWNRQAPVGIARRSGWPTVVHTIVNYMGF